MVPKIAVISRQSCPFPPPFIHAPGFLHWMFAFPAISMKKNSWVSSTTSTTSSESGLPTCSGSLKSPSNLSGTEATTATFGRPAIWIHWGSGPTVNKAPCTPLVKIRVFKPRPEERWKDQQLFGWRSYVQSLGFVGSCNYLKVTLWMDGIHKHIKNLDNVPTWFVLRHTIHDVFLYPVLTYLRKPF